MAILVKNGDFGKNCILGQVWQFLSKLTITVEKNNFGQNSNFVRKGQFFWKRTILVKMTIKTKLTIKQN